MKPIEFVDKYGIVMSKPIWSEQELALARCYNFVISGDSESVQIIVDIRRTAKIAVINFFALSFRAMWESVMRKFEKDQIVNKLDEIYSYCQTKSYEYGAEKLPDYWGILREYQKESIWTMLGRKNNLLSLEQGMGKSLVAASVSRLLGVKRTLIVCIPVAKWNWQDDLVTKFGYNPLYFSILDTKKSKTVKALSPYHERFLITHYESIPKHLDYILSTEIGHIIIDESQNIKNHSTNKYKYIEKIVKAFPNAKISLLSGTPIKNRVDDLYAYFKLTGHEMGHNRAKFIREFAQMKTGRNIERCVGARNIDQLVTNMANFMIRKNKKECPELPDRNYMKVLMDIGDYREEYDRIMLDLIQQQDRGAINGHLISMNRVFATAKVKNTIEMIEDLIDKGEKVVVFSSFTEPLLMLQRHFSKNSVLVNGDVEHSERFQRVKKFTNDPDCMVFLGNIIAAGTSLNMTVASEVIFLNFPFTSTDIAQAVDRLHRLGQLEKVNIYFMTCKDTIDENLYSLVASKQGEINQIIDGGEGVDYEGGDIKDQLFKQLKLNTNGVLREVSA